VLLPVIYDEQFVANGNSSLIIIYLEKMIHKHQYMLVQNQALLKVDSNLVQIEEFD